MKVAKSLPPVSKNDKRILAASIIIFVVSAVIVVIVLRNRSIPPTIYDLKGNQVEQPQGTLAVGMPDAASLVDRMTAMPSAQPLTGPLAADVHAIADLVSKCGDYNQQRRDEMNANIGWMLEPNTLPADIILALGNNINGGLLKGMSTYTLGQWGEKGKSPTSCLVPIGKKLNDMLAANDEARFKEFDGV